MSTSRGDDAVRLCQGSGDGLFNQDMLAGGKGLIAYLGVEMVGKQHHHGIDTRVFKDAPVILMAIGDLECIGKALQGGGMGVAGGHEREAVRMATHALGVMRPDATGSDESDPQDAHETLRCGPFYRSGAPDFKTIMLIRQPTILILSGRWGWIKIPMAPHLLLTRRPHTLGTIRDIQIDAIGHFPRRTAPGTDAVFSYHSLVFLAAGTGTYRMQDGTDEAVGPGSMWCLNPGHRYIYSPRPGGWWEEFFIDISGSGIKRWYDRGWLVLDPRLFRLAPVGRLVSAIREIALVMREGTASASDRSILLLEQLLLEMCLSRTGTADAEHHDERTAIAAAISHVHQHYATEIDFLKLSRRLGLSQTSLRRGMLALTGEPPARYVRRLRCEIAKKLLRETTMPIGQIAASVGIPATVVFSRIFRRMVGVVPTHYRQGR
jgi:AraC family transcriptional regulator of arabinose operon